MTLLISDNQHHQRLRGSSNTQVAARNIQWTIVGECLSHEEIVFVATENKINYVITWFKLTFLSKLPSLTL